jgi:hypothetical protein
MAISEAAYLYDVSKLPVELIDIVDSYGEMRHGMPLHRLHVDDGNFLYMWMSEDGAWVLADTQSGMRRVPIEYARDVVAAEKKHDLTPYIIARAVLILICAVIGWYVLATLGHRVATCLTAVVLFCRCMWTLRICGRYRHLSEDGTRILDVMRDVCVYEMMLLLPVPVVQIVGLTLCTINDDWDLPRGRRITQFVVNALIHGACAMWPWVCTANATFITVGSILTHL